MVCGEGRREGAEAKWWAVQPLLLKARLAAKDARQDK